MHSRIARIETVPPVISPALADRLLKTGAAYYLWTPPNKLQWPPSDAFVQWLLDERDRE